MASRLQLHDKLIEILRQTLPIDEADQHVKYQPGTNTKLVYPCIIYRLIPRHVQHADNNAYITKDCYTVTVIDRDPDSKIRNDMFALPFCRMGSPFVSDNLYHFPFTLYW